jgi:lipid A 3-O-deacylase
MKTSAYVRDLIGEARLCRVGRLLGATALLWLTKGAAMADERRSWVPDRIFTQAGVAPDAHTLVFGAIRDWQWQRPLAGGVATGYWEVSFGRWNSELDEGGRGSAWVTQLGLTPVLRWRPQSWSEAWFVEAGIGANMLLPVYRSRDKRFSTTFNFGDHVGIGKRFGESGKHELSLRIQHFSNAGIKHPNPGENFLQLRYAWRY